MVDLKDSTDEEKSQPISGGPRGSRLIQDSADGENELSGEEEQEKDEDDEASQPISGGSRGSRLIQDSADGENELSGEEEEEEDEDDEDQGEEADEASQPIS